MKKPTDQKKKARALLKTCTSFVLFVFDEKGNGATTSFISKQQMAFAAAQLFKKATEDHP